MRTAVPAEIAAYGALRLATAKIDTPSVLSFSFVSEKYACELIDVPVAGKQIFGVDQRRTARGNLWEAGYGKNEDENDDDHSSIISLHQSRSRRCGRHV